MPTISVFKIDWTDLHTPDADEDDPDEYLYFNGRPYVVDEVYECGNDKERVI